MANAELNNVSMDSIEDLTAVNALDDIIVNAINTIRKNKKLLCQKATALQAS